MEFIVEMLFLFILGLFASLSYKYERESIGFSVGAAFSIILLICLLQSVNFEKFAPSLSPSPTPSLSPSPSPAPSYNEELIKLLINIVNEKEEKNETFYTNYIFKIVSFIITYVLGLMSPYFTKMINKKLKKWRKERKKHKKDKKKIRDDSKTKRQ